jgi:6-phosphofructokinase 2
MPGAKLNSDEVRRCVDQIAQLDPPPEFLVLSGSLPPGTDDDLYAEFIEAVDPRCRVVLDTSGKPLYLGVREHLFLIKPNKRELGQLAGQEVTSDAQIRDVARSLIDAGKVDVVVTSIGSGGAVLTTADAHHHIRTPTVEIRSKVGAGDSMVAGIVVALTQGRPIDQAVRYGVAAGAAAVMTDGTELCRCDDTDRLYDVIMKTP